MTFRHLVIASAFGVVAACVAPSVPFTESQAAAVRDSAKAFLGEFRRLSSAAEWDSVGALYSEGADFRFLENGELQYLSAQAVREALRGIPPGQRIQTEYQDVEVQAVNSGLAIVTGRFTTSFADSVRTLFSFRGALTLVLGHEAAGWRIISGHTSAPVPRGP